MAHEKAEDWNRIQMFTLWTSPLQLRSTINSRWYSIDATKQWHKWSHLFRTYLGKTGCANALPVSGRKWTPAVWEAGDWKLIQRCMTEGTIMWNIVNIEKDEVLGTKERVCVLAKNISKPELPSLLPEATAKTAKCDKPYWSCVLSKL